jgi:hypothetical protein
MPIDRKQGDNAVVFDTSMKELGASVRGFLDGITAELTKLRRIHDIAFLCARLERPFGAGCPCGTACRSMARRPSYQRTASYKKRAGSRRNKRQKAAQR